VVRFFAAAGCAKQEPTAQVHGKVTWDGIPVAEGEIGFVTLGMPPEVLLIRDGMFQGRVRIGQRRVEIYAYRRGESLSSSMTSLPEAADSISPPGASGVGKENFIPGRFNSGSHLEAVVARSGPIPFEFNLSAAPPQSK